MPDLDTVVSDTRLRPVIGRVQLAFPLLPEDTEFVTWVQPRRVLQDGTKVPAQALFGVVGQNPTAPPGIKLMSTAGTSMSMWIDAEMEFNHLRTRDPLQQIFMALARQHLQTLANLASISN